MKGGRGRCIGRFCCCTIMVVLLLLISIVLALALVRVTIQSILYAILMLNSGYDPQISPWVGLTRCQKVEVQYVTYF